MRGKLKDAALLKATENLNNLQEVFQFCERNPTHQDSCSTSPEFWKGTIERIFGNIIVLQRGDLTTGTDWYNFAKLLGTGVEYKYCVDSIAGGGISNQPEPFALVDWGDGDPRIFPFRIPAMLPEAGTSGFFTRFSLAEPFRKQKTSFYLHPNQTIAQRKAARYVGEQFHWRFEHRITGDLQIQIGAGAEIDLDAFPEESFFVETVNAVLANGDTRGDWSITFTDDEGDQQIVSLQWDISPITF
jgi:hypothetical protein